MKISEIYDLPRISGHFDQIIEKSFVSCKIYRESLKTIAYIIYNNVIS